MKRCPNSLSLRRFSGLLASSLTSSVSFFPWSLWAKSLARLNSDAIVRSLREGRGPRHQPTDRPDQHATRERDEAIAAAMGEVLASVRRKGANRSRSGTTEVDGFLMVAR